jgi:ribosomal protein S18 acetylase RimI-like enzyme
MKLTILKKEDFEQLFDIMVQSFPSAEYRKKEKQYAILDDTDYSITVHKEESIIQAFIAVWNLGNFIFAEHLAVSPKNRNSGIGSAFMREYLSQSKLPIVLEVEDIQDEISKRRIGFYERLGFVLSDIRYNQPNFDNSDVVIPLRIMYYDKNGCLDIQSIKNTIFKKIYKSS